jgi:hypothetical protein
LIAIVRVFGERLHRHFGETIGNVSVGARLARIGYRIIEVSEHDPRRRVVDIWQMPNQQLEQNDAERVEVAPAVHTVTAALLGRHVIGRAAHQPGLRDRAFFADDCGKPEVDDFDEVVP